MLNTFGNLLQLPGVMALSTEEDLAPILAAKNALASQEGSSACPCRDWLGQCQSPEVCSGAQRPATFPGQGIVHGAVNAGKGIAKVAQIFSDLPRLLTLILGLMLIAAALFSHPAVREKIVSAGKAAAKAGALAA